MRLQSIRPIGNAHHTAGTVEVADGLPLGVKDAHLSVGLQTAQRSLITTLLFHNVVRAFTQCMQRRTTEFAVLTDLAVDVTVWSSTAFFW